MRRKKNPSIERSKAIRGIERQQHFAEGKSLASWRGRHTVTRDRHRADSRRACRKWKRDET